MTEPIRHTIDAEEQRSLPARTAMAGICGCILMLCGIAFLYTGSGFIAFIGLSAFALMLINGFTRPRTRARAVVTITLFTPLLLLTAAQRYLGSEADAQGAVVLVLVAIGMIIVIVRSR